jgi:hypothetical protein
MYYIGTSSSTSRIQTGWMRLYGKHSNHILRSVLMSYAYAVGASVSVISTIDMDKLLNFHTLLQATVYLEVNQPKLSLALHTLISDVGSYQCDRSGVSCYTCSDQCLITHLYAGHRFYMLRIWLRMCICTGLAYMNFKS